MDVSLKGEPLGRVEIVLFSDVSPLAAENLRRLCTGGAAALPVWWGQCPGRAVQGRALPCKKTGPCLDTGTLLQHVCTGSGAALHSPKLRCWDAC